MITHNSSNNLDNLLKQISQQRAQSPINAPQNNPVQKTPPIPSSEERPPARDIVSITGNQNSSTKQAGLISEKIQKTEKGFQKIQEFENSKGNKFTRIEETETTEDRSKRLVIQQNDSGSTTVLENILDRQEDGTFRLIQRFTDETGETKTNVTVDFNPKDADILLGRPPASAAPKDNPFQATRGTQIDLSV